MTFARKIFIAVFISTLMVGSLLIWAAHKYVESRSEEDFVSRYTVLTRILADTLSRLDTNTEALMLNAAKVVAARDERHGLLSTDVLKALRSELSVTHIFVVDKNGKFIRSTNEDPSLIPNAFSFCGQYREMISGQSNGEATPIIKPNPEPKPYKFLFVPNKDRSRLLEVGVRVDFIAKTLTEALGSDSNLKSLSVYAPDGTPFGTFADSKVVFKSEKAILPEKFEAPVDDGNFSRFYTKVTSSHPRCCQCDVSGTSKNGEYYYVLETAVSKSELQAIQAKASYIFLLVGFGNLILSWLLARFLSRRLVRNIETAVARVRSMKDGGSLKGRINLQADDEVSFLTQEFDRLLESLEESQRKLIEAEMVRSKVELSKVVAHNIRSPILAIEMMLPTMITVSEKTKRILRNSIGEIKQLAEKLKASEKGSIEPTHLDSGLVSIPVFLQDFVIQKRLELSERSNLRITLDCSEIDLRAMVHVSSCELSSVLSNIVNNAVEAIGTEKGIVALNATADSESCFIRISDSGRGIPVEVAGKLGSVRVSTKGSERGIGLMHAFESVRSWGGSIEIASDLNTETNISIRLPRYIEITQREQQKLRVAEKPAAHG